MSGKPKCQWKSNDSGAARGYRTGSGSDRVGALLHAPTRSLPLPVLYTPSAGAVTMDGHFGLPDI